MKKLCMTLVLALAPLWASAQVALEGKWQLDPMPLEQFALAKGDEAVVWLHGSTHYQADGRSIGEGAVLVIAANEQKTELLRVPLALRAEYRFDGSTLAETLTDCRPGQAVIHASVQNDAALEEMGRMLASLACIGLGKELKSNVRVIDADTLRIDDDEPPMIYRRVK